jgi:hypothetical protein
MKTIEEAQRPIQSFDSKQHDWQLIDLLHDD